jgi:hypothetical protein
MSNGGREPNVIGPKKFFKNSDRHDGRLMLMLTSIKSTAQ